MADVPAKNGRRRWSLLSLVPLAAVLALGGFLLQGLYLDSRVIPSALIGRPVPSFELPALPGRPPGLASSDLAGEVSLVNVFASWCVACRAEHPILMRLKEAGVVPVHGLNHKDEPQAALDWLRRFGDPYDRIGADRNGRVSIDFGVYGVPESFVIDAHGRIVCKQIGPIDERALKDKLMPAIAAARAGGPVAC
jgi:cytochrome c biogenesis protein CcmG/thiol:disulfide interchange protein DsbE